MSGAMGYLQNSLSDDIQDTASQLGGALVELIGDDASQALLNYGYRYFESRPLFAANATITSARVVRCSAALRRDCAAPCTARFPLQFPQCSN